MKFRVHVHFHDRSSGILRETLTRLACTPGSREASGRVFQSVHAKRVSLDAKRLNQLAPGIDADYEYTGVFSALSGA